MADKFNSNDGVTGPSRNPYPVVPNDGAALDPVPKALRVGTGGTIVLRGVDASVDVTLQNVANGETIDIRALYVRATGTTASGIVALA